jgi:hypothetical protein
MLPKNRKSSIFDSITKKLSISQSRASQPQLSNLQIPVSSPKVVLKPLNSIPKQSFIRIISNPSMHKRQSVSILAKTTKQPSRKLFAQNPSFRPLASNKTSLFVKVQPSSTMKEIKKVETFGQPSNTMKEMKRVETVATGLKKVGKNKPRKLVPEKNIQTYTETIETSSEFDDEDEYIFIVDCANEIMIGYVNEFLEHSCFAIANFTHKQMLSASMVLFSSTILDRYIQEVLAEETKDAVIKEYDMSKQEEFIDSLDSIILSVFTEELSELVKKHINLQLSTVICEEICRSLSLQSLVAECYSEEQSQISYIECDFQHYIIEEYLKQDWLDILVEDEISLLRLERNFELFPTKLQKELASISTDFLVSFLAEAVYYDYLNDFVAGSWLESLVRLMIQPGTADTDCDFSVPVYIPPKRTATNICKFLR